MIALAIPCGIVLAELGLKLFAPVAYRRPLPRAVREEGFERLHRAALVPGLEYEMRPDFELKTPWSGEIVIHTNRFGMRGPQIELAKTSGTIRLAVVGDSYAFGHGVADEEVYARRLEELLRAAEKDGRSFEVLNFGVTGYSTVQEALLVRQRVLSFEPDLILIGYVLNDPDVHPEAGLLHQSFHEREAWERSEVLRLVAGWKRTRAIERAGGYFQYLHDDDVGLWSTVVDAFADIRNAARDADVPVAVVIFPLFQGESWDDYPCRDVHAQVAELARANGFAVLDLIQRLPARGKPPRDLQVEGSPHPNALGHRLCAEEIQLFLTERFPDLSPPG